MAGLKLFSNFPQDSSELSLTEKFRRCLKTLRMLRACCVDEDLCGIADQTIKEVAGKSKREKGRLSDPGPGNPETG